MKHTKLLIGTLAGLLIASVIAFMGCGTPPTKLESTFFNNQTNYVTLVTTNYTHVTNVTPIVTEVTNTVRLTNNVIETVVEKITNTVISVITQTNLATNTVAQIEMAPKPEIAQGAKTIVDFFAPGISQLVYLGVGGLLSVWAGIRNRKMKATSVVLAQGTETLLAMLQTTPQGQKLVDAAKEWLAKHQELSGVHQIVDTLLEKEVSPGDAQTAAEQLAKIIAQP